MDALRPKNEPPPEELDAATIAAIEEGLQSEEQGDFVTLEQAVDFARERRTSWKTGPKASA